MICCICPLTWTFVFPLNTSIARPGLGAWSSSHLPLCRQPAVAHPRVPRFVKKVLITFAIGRCRPYVQGRWGTSGRTARPFVLWLTPLGFQIVIWNKLSHQVTKTSPSGALFRVVSIGSPVQTLVCLCSWSGFCIAVWIEQRESGTHLSSAVGTASHSLDAKLFA